MDHFLTSLAGVLTSLAMMLTSLARKLRRLLTKPTGPAGMPASPVTMVWKGGGYFCFSHSSQFVSSRKDAILLRSGTRSF